MPGSNLEIVQRAYAAARGGDMDTVASLLHPDVYWGAPVRTVDGCQNRKQAVQWMRGAIAQGIMVDIVRADELPDGRVVLLLQRNSPREGDTEIPAPHGQIVGFRDGKIAEMLVYPDAAEALQVAGLEAAPL
jgi:ketosteroid isomerase-like protein